jgi:chromosome segregation ATPase
MKLELDKKDETNVQLRQKVIELERRVDDYDATLRKIHPKYREAIRERGDFELSRNAAQSQAAVLTERIQARISEIESLKEQKKSLETELASSRTALGNSPIPEVAELAKAQEAIRSLEDEKARLEKRIASLQKDFDFTRDSYQKASSSAVEAMNELGEMKEKMVELKRKASDTTVRIAEIQRSNANKENIERIQELESLISDREQELKKVHEELKVKTNGRRETRGTSVPRSPRMGSGAMSPRPQFSRPAGGSRQNSPAPGDAPREGFRDAILFPPSGPGSHRWQHLT